MIPDAGSVGKESSTNGQAVGTLDYLRLLWPDPPAGYLLLWTKQDKRSYWFPSTDLEGLARSAVWHAERTDVWLACALSPADHGPNSRCIAEQTIAIPSLWADIDVVGPAHKKKDLPPDVGAAAALAGEAPLPPSLFVLSGHGLQPHWLLKEAWQFDGADERNQAAALLKDWQAHLQERGAEHGWRLDSTHDLARIMRIPGTVNRKGEPVPVQIELLTPLRRYDPSELRDALAERTGREATPRQTTKTAPTRQPGDRVRALNALGRLNKRRAVAYHDWLNVGMALHWTAADEEMLAVWGHWSQSCPEKYQEDACCKKWETFGKVERDKEVTLGSLIFWAQQDEAAGRPAAVIIRDYLKEFYSPAFRREGAIFSNIEGRLIRYGEALRTIQTTELMDLLKRASNAAHLNEAQLPPFYTRQAPIAWADLLSKDLKEEDTAAAEGEVAERAVESFHDRVAAALNFIVSIGFNYTSKDGEEHTRVEKRPLINFANLFAKPSGWEDVRGYKIWSCLGAAGLEVAISFDLFGQLSGFKDIADLGQPKFSRRCRHYGVGRSENDSRIKQQGKTYRCVLLSPEFLSRLLGTSTEPEEASGDGMTEAPRACAREEESSFPSPDAETMGKSSPNGDGKGDGSGDGKGDGKASRHPRQAQTAGQGDGSGDG